MVLRVKAISTLPVKKRLLQSSQSKQRSQDQTIKSK